MMGAKNLIHADDVIIERYAMGKLEGETLDTFEEHLLVCRRCETKLTEMDNYLRALRVAAPRFSEPQPFWRRMPVLAMRPPVLAAIGLSLALVVAVPLLRKETGLTYQAVQLSSFRGSEVEKAKSGKGIDLSLDASDLPPASSYFVVAVSGSGDSVWEGAGESKGGKVHALVAVSLAAGSYWVRLYSNSLKTELLREYSLIVE